MPPALQEIAPGSYDVVVATNVLHATKDIRRTLRNAKAALKANGLIVLNEISTNSLFHHLTFGLLDGWWLFADPELRLPGGPALGPETWRAVLAQEGFRSVFFPAETVHGSGQQVIVAESDGFVRQSSGLDSPLQQEEEDAAEEPWSSGDDATAVENAVVMAGPRDVATGRLLAYLRRRVAEALCVDPATLDSRSRPFADALLGEFGMDSLSANSLRNTVRRELGVDIAVQRIIAEKVHHLVEALYELLLLKQVSNEPRPEGAGEMETFVF
jgi:hypothetical protein